MIDVSWGDGLTMTISVSTSGGYTAWNTKTYPCSTPLGYIGVSQYTVMAVEELTAMLTSTGGGTVRKQ